MTIALLVAVLAASTPEASAAAAAVESPAALAVAVLPADAPSSLAASARRAEQALARAVQPPFTVIETDRAAVRARLAAGGPACGDDPKCLCAASGLVPGGMAFAVRIEGEAASPATGTPTASRSAAATTWNADVRLLAPCDARILGRRAEIVPADAAALERFVQEVAEDLLAARVTVPLPPPAPTATKSSTDTPEAPAGASR